MGIMDKPPIELYEVRTDGASFFVQGNEDTLRMSPQEIFDAIKLFQKVLFAWHELTGKSIDEGHPT